MVKRYWHIRIRNPRNFTKIRTQDIGRRGHTLRRAGFHKTKRRWMTTSFLIAKEDARLKNGDLVATNPITAKVLAYIRYRYGPFKYIGGSDFRLIRRPKVGYRRIGRGGRLRMKSISVGVPGLVGTTWINE